MLAELMAGIAVMIWLYLLLGRGWFWRVRETAPPPLKRRDIPVAVVIPARNEATHIGAAIESLLSQDYPGRIEVFVVDDHSTDGTAEAASNATVIPADPLPPGWTGKLWAISCGLRHALVNQPGYILLTDADIVHAIGNIAGLVARAEDDGLDLASLMVKLRSTSLAERALMPAFLFFFLKLYPPAWIAELESQTAGAAGGCILLRPSALKRIGGIESIRGELIDDCALARAVKRGGPIWMGVTDQTRSTRPYETFSEIERVIARTAFTQLRHSTLLLCGTILGLLWTYLAPPVIAILGPSLLAHGLGLAAWLLMIISYVPTLRFYRVSSLWAPLLPLVALFYLAATVHSACAYWTGRGGQWKGRIQDPS